MAKVRVKNGNAPKSFAMRRNKARLIIHIKTNANGEKREKGWGGRPLI